MLAICATVNSKQFGINLEQHVDHNVCLKPRRCYNNGDKRRQGHDPRMMGREQENKAGMLERYFRLVLWQELNETLVARGEPQGYSWPWHSSVSWDCI